MLPDSIFSYPLVTTVIAGLFLIGIVGKLLKFSFRQIAVWYLYVAVLAVVVVMDSVFFPFIGGKDWFFRFTIELALIAFILHWAFEAKKGEIAQLIRTSYRKPIVIAVTIFVVAFLLACAFAVDAHAAFWSNYERGEGGFQMIHYYLFFMLLVMLLKEEGQWKNIFRFSLAAALLMIGYGILGNLMVNTFIGPYASGNPPTGLWHLLFDGRFGGSLGNPAYVDAYLLFSGFYAVYLWISAKTEKRSNKLTPWLYTALLVVFLIFFILGQTRGAFLGLGAGVIALLLYFAFTGSAKVRRWAAAVAILLVVLGIGAYAERNSAFVQNLPEGRLLQISLQDGTAQTRLWVWGEAWKGFLDRPVLGWGPENFTAVYDKYFNPKFYVPGANTETWFDRAHSIYFDYLSETGILGFLAYFSIFFVIFWEFFRRRQLHRRGENGNAITILRGAFLALPIAYLIQGVAIFDVFPMYLNTFLFFAFATYYFTVHTKAAPAIASPSTHNHV
ncbi:MAG TPA: O-antigen ligase family protein [Candidatus Paceibacterota bacterium]|nr:O-antigen ligase family protein [Candidatus Paceibacterota bacterium]